MSFKMKKVVRRKLFLFGRYSLALLPPKKWLSKLGVQRGDLVDIELDSPKRRLIVRFVNQPKNQPTKKKTVGNGKTRNGWEPIPRI